MTNYYIADLIVSMESFGRIVRQAEKYRMEGDSAPDIQIKSNWQSLKARQPHLSESDCEYLSTGFSFYYQLLNFDGMLLHSSAVVLDGRAYLFSAPCGTGKSTHTALWCKEFAEKRAFILNDDKPALRLHDDVWYAYGTPWSGKTAQNVNIRVPLGGICILQRGDENRVVPYGGASAVHDLLEQTTRPRNPVQMQKILALLDHLLRHVPLWRMECTPTPDAAHLARDVMVNAKI